jgi:hypothetical protein
MIAKTITKVMWGRVLIHNKVVTPEQWSACVIEHARAGGQTPLEHVLVQKQLLKPKQVELIAPKVQALAQKHAYEFIPVPKTPSRLAAVIAAAQVAAHAHAAPGDGAIPLADPAMERLHGPDVGITLPPPGAMAPVKAAATALADDGTIELAVEGDHDALHKANEVAWANEMDEDGAEQAPVTVQQLASEHAAKHKLDREELNDDGTIQLAQ